MMKKNAVSATQTVDIHAAGIVGILSAPHENATQRGFYFQTKHMDLSENRLPSGKLT